MADITEEDVENAIDAAVAKIPGSIFYDRKKVAVRMRAALQSYVDAHPEISGKTGTISSEYAEGFKAGAEAMKMKSAAHCDGMAQGYRKIHAGISSGLAAASSAIMALPLPTPGGYRRP